MCWTGPGRPRGPPRGRSPSSRWPSGRMAAWSPAATSRRRSDRGSGTSRRRPTGHEGGGRVITRRIARWFDERLRATSFAHDALNKAFPDHWSFMLGEIALYSFVILVLTGTFLAFFYAASTTEVIYHGSYAPLRGQSVSEAYASVLRISFDVRGGMVFRQMHHWAANVFVAAIVAHVMRIFFTGAFRRPRELNWLIGVTLLLFAIFNGFSGYSLPDDLLSGTGLRIAYSVGLSVPFVGTWLAFLIFGGEFPADDILRRLLVAHIMIVPAILGGLIAVHLAVLWR